MDPRLLITGRGAVTDTPCDPLPFLPRRKARKFMGEQDALAVVAAGRALSDAGLQGPLGPRAGLYLVVGHIPFTEADLEPLIRGSLDDEGAFSMAAFSTRGMTAVRPVLTFRCLPNMPAYHVTVTFGLRGPYAVLYPGPEQVYLALEQAAMALELGLVDRVLLGAVAHRRNELVAHHHRRLGEDPAALRDGAGFVVLETPASAAERGAPLRGELTELHMDYEPFEPFETLPAHTESGADGAFGAASLLVSLASAQGSLAHNLYSQGLSASSRWELS